MFLFADFVVYNGIDFMVSAISRTLCIIDKLVIVDTGSTDGSFEVAQALAKVHPDKVSVTQFGSLAPNYVISEARNAALALAPSETTWHWNISDDEVYNWEDMPKLREFLEIHENSKQRFVMLHFHEYGKNDSGALYSGGKHKRAMIHRYDPGMRWVGSWGREGLVYPDGKHHVTANKNDWLDSRITYHHFNWLREKQNSFVCPTYGRIHG